MKRGGHPPTYYDARGTGKLVPAVESGVWGNAAYSTAPDPVAALLKTIGTPPADAIELPTTMCLALRVIGFRGDAENHLAIPDTAID